MILLAALFFPAFVFPQVDNITADNDIYNFLNRMYINGILTDYDDIILPLSRKQIKSALDIILEKKGELTLSDQIILDRIRTKLGYNDSINVIQFFDEFPQKFLNNIAAESEKHLYFYNDSIVSLFIDPILGYRFIYSDLNKQGSSIFNFGGRVRGSYNDWFAFYIEGTNGSVIGSRETAKLDNRVGQSFTFNKTQINYFDNTVGYLRVENDLMNLQIGRERVLWGSGQINKLILSENPQVFDFVKFNIHYKKLRYDFLHGWLVMQPEFIQVYKDISKEKRSKYLAVSRLGFNPNSDLSLGISQMIIYSNRPFEAAYLNPFLFWESAQRSLNDLDNSFLAFDGKLRVSDGLLLNASAIFDDINFGRLFKGEWAGHNNGFAWQTGISLTSPLIFENTVVDLEYLQLRPYIFSHPGYNESLTYTNNGYLLGVDLNPNSTLFSLKISHDLTDWINLTLNYFHSIHGNNIYDSLGNRIKNVGGDVFGYYTKNDSRFAYLLDGIRETEDRLRLGVNWEFLNSFFLKFEWEYRNNSLIADKSYNAFFSSFYLNLF